MESFLGYTIYCFENNKFNSKGFYSNYEIAKKMLIKNIQYYLNNNDYDENIIDQLNNSEIKKNCKNGLILYQLNNDEIQINKRIQSYFTFLGYTEIEICKYLIICIEKDNLITNIIKNTKRKILKDNDNTLIIKKNLNNQNPFLEELKLVIQKKRIN